MVSKQSLHSLQKVELSSTLCNCCNPQNVARQAAERACYAPQSNRNLSRNAIATQLQTKLHSVALGVELDSTFCNDCRDFLRQSQSQVAAQHCNV